MAYFWLIAGFMAGIAAAFFAVQLWRPDAVAREGVTYRPRWVIAAATGAFLLVAVMLYFQIGRPELIDQGAMATAASNHAEAASVAGSATGSMAEAAAKLASKLAAGGGSDADWQLLQQSYEFLGDTEAAGLAQQHQLKPSVSTAGAKQSTATQVTTNTVTDQVALATYQQVVANKPNDAAAWLAIAQLQRTARNFAEANQAFAQVIKLKAMDADAWADYADVCASIADTLTNAKTRAALDAALKLEPQHSKALWLKASLAHEERRYADALQLWQQLRAAIPDSSSDASIIDANIKEAQSLAGAAVTVAVPKVSPASVRVSGSVALDPAFKNRVTDGMTLFVYAKAPDSAAPVAAYRTSVKSWPVKFVLDDTQAMLPTRKLSQFDKVTVSARLSRSGQALAQAGDLQTESVDVVIDSKQSVALRISNQVP